VKKWWVIWRYKQAFHWMCIYITCMCSWILGRWMRWLAYPSRMEHFKKCACAKRISTTQQLSTTLGILGKCHIPYLCHLMLVCYTSRM
jgi:hypothetical protein